MNRILLLIALLVSVLMVTTGCHTRTHWTEHFNAAGNLVHKDKTKSSSLFGKSESARLQGEYDYVARVDDRTNLIHSVRFGTEGEKKCVDSEGIKATGSAAGGAIGAAARAAATGN